MAIGRELRADQLDIFALHRELRLPETLAVDQQHGIGEPGPPIGRVNFIDTRSRRSLRRACGAFSMRRGAGGGDLGESHVRAGKCEDTDCQQAPGLRHCNTFHWGE